MKKNEKINVNKKELIKLMKGWILERIDIDEDGSVFGEDINCMFDIIEKGVLEELEKKFEIIW